MQHFAELTDRKLAATKGAGAAGGLGFALLLLGGTRRSGVDMVMEAVGLAEKVRDADLVVTGEGAFDFSSGAGKVPYGVAEVAAQQLVPCIALAGQVLIGSREMRALGVESAYSVVDLVGEERALERPGGGAGGSRHPDSPDVVPLTPSRRRGSGRQADRRAGNRTMRGITADVRPLDLLQAHPDDHWRVPMTEQVDTAQEIRTDGINLTDTASSKVKSLLAQEGRDDLQLRIAVQPGGCSGLRYQLFFDERNLDGDLVTDFNGVAVVVDRMSVPYLNGATIDFVDSIEKQGFTIDNPNAGGSCACGDSFH